MEEMRQAPETSFDEDGCPDSRPSYQWYGQIETGCYEVHGALIKWKEYLEEANYQRRAFMNEERLQSDIEFLNMMHRENCGVSDFIQVVDAVDLAF